VGAQELAEQSMWFMDNMARIGGGVLIAAGIYQLTPLKSICLSKCRSPLAFVLGSWRDGYGGAVRMGLEHGLYCIGCCWLFFLIIFPLGMMSIAVLAAITALIFAEKSLPYGRQVGTAAGVLLIAYGALVVFVPDALPTMV
jgi:predicted metal-binding membrane protein